MSSGMGPANGGPARAAVWASRDLPAGRRPAANAAAGLVSVSFFGAALRRRARLWIAVAVAGLLAGLAIYLLAPPPYQASTSLILTHDPNENPADAMQTDVALAQTRSVAARVVHELGLQESTGRLLSDYTVTAATDRIMTITASAPSTSAATRQAASVAAASLRFRASELTRQQGLVLQSLRQQVSQAQRLVSADTAAIASAEARPQASKQVGSLQAKAGNDTQVLAGLQRDMTDYRATTAREIEDSYVIDPASALPSARPRTALEYTVSGLLLGLVAGLGIVTVGALTSDRLVRRDDIGRALGAPVGLSVGPVTARPLSRRVLGSAVPRSAVPRSAVPRSARERDLQRVVEYARSLIPGRADPSAPAAALAVTAAGRPGAAALLVARLAVSCAQAGQQVMVADLAEGAPAARILGARARGVQQASADGCRLTVVVPDEVLPAGPLSVSPASRGTAPGGADPASRGTTLGGAGPAAALVAAYQAADVVLTLAVADPATGADYLAGWAAAAVVIVTAGECSADRIQATAEVIRLAGIPLATAVLLGARADDYSPGVSDVARPAVTTAGREPVPAVGELGMAGR